MGSPLPGFELLLATILSISQIGILTLCRVNQGKLDAGRLAIAHDFRLDHALGIRECHFGCREQEEEFSADRDNKELIRGPLIFRHFLICFRFSRTSAASN